MNIERELAEMTADRDRWLACAYALHLALANDGIEANNELSQAVRAAALAEFDKLNSP